MQRNSSSWKNMHELLNAAHASRICYVPRNRAEAQLLQRHMVKGEVVQPFPRMYALKSLWEKLKPNERELFIMRAYAELHPEATFCSTSAALAHGLPVSYAQLGKLHVRASVGKSMASGVQLVRHGACETPVEIVDGMRVENIVQATVDATRMGSFEDGLVIADAFLSRCNEERVFLEEAVQELAQGRRGIEMAREVARYADRRAESGGESFARGVMIREGIMPTDLQKSFADPLDNRKSIRVDFVFELRSGEMVLGEFDGKIKYTDEQLLAGKDSIEVILDERKRESRLSMYRAPIVRFGWKEVREPGELKRMLATAGVTSKTLLPKDYRRTAWRGSEGMGLVRL